MVDGDWGSLGQICFLSIFFGKMLLLEFAGCVSLDCLVHVVLGRTGSNLMCG